MEVLSNTLCMADFRDCLPTLSALMSLPLVLVVDVLVPDQMW